MKTRSIFSALAAVIIAIGGFKAYQLVQHARLDLVTLNVTGAPLADVLARVARQTRETILADQSLGGMITLNVRKAPLRQVLGQIADQAGGFSRLNFAVGSSEAALSQLQNSLRQGQPFEHSGWTNLSAAVADVEPPSESRVVRHGGLNAERAKTPDAPGQPQAGVRMLVTRDAPGGLTGGSEVKSNNEGGSGAARVTLLATGPDGVSRTVDLSPERLLVEAGLVTTLALNLPVNPSPERAAELAHQVGGTWSLLYALEAVPLPPGGLPPELNRFGWTSHEHSPEANGPPEPGDMEATVRRHRFDQLTRLTPEQRARAAAQQPGPGMRFEVDVER